MKKTICFFCGNIDLSGGTERVTSIIANALLRSGYDVIILSVVYGSNPYFDLDKSIRVLSLNMEGKSSNFSNIEIVRKLRLYLKALEIDYIVDVDIILSLYSIPASFSLKTKVVSWEHFNYFVNVGDFFQRAKRKLARTLAVKYSKNIITLTEKDRSFYLQAHHCQADIVAINNPITKNNTELSTLRLKNVISVGRLTPQKGFDFLLAAWQIVSPKKPDWTLTIVGSGNDEVDLKRLAHELGIASSIHFTGNTKDVNRFYLDSSIYVMSSRFEGFPMVLLEAKSFGLPIVSFDCDTGPREIIRKNIDGLLVEKENFPMLARALLDLINNEDKRLLFGLRAREDDRFNLEKTISRWEMIFN